MSRGQRETLLSAAFAVWGLAIALALLPFWRKPSPPDQLMGLAKTLGFDAHGPMRWMLGLILLPVLLPLLSRPLIPLLAAGRSWARNAALVAPLVALWIISVHPTPLWAIVPCAFVVTASVLLRNRALCFSRHDIVLVPVFLTTILALVDLTNVSAHDGAVYAALLLFTLRVAVALVPSPLPPGLAFAVAPLALVLQTGFFARDQRYFGWHALVIVIVSPFLLRLFLRNRRRAVRAVALVVYPLALFAYWNAINTTTAEGKPRVNFFEYGHALLPASEMLRGELPYRDILPAHGLIEDGGFDALVLATGNVNVGRALKTREVVGTLAAIALYALAWAVTGSPHAALLSVLLSILTGFFAPGIRLLPALATLATIAAAVRWRRPRLFAYAAFGTVVCGATSLDFGAYTLLTLIVALWRTRPPWRAVAYKRAAIGLAAGAIPLFLGLALFGILDDFVYSTFVEVLGVGPAYTLGFFNAPNALSARPFFPEILAAALQPGVLLYLVWPLLAIFAGTTLARRWPRRFEPMVLVAVWSVLTGISYAERQHLYFGMAAMVLLVGVIVTLLRRHNVLAIPAVLVALVIANPTTHLSVIGVNRTTRAPPADWVEIRDLPRARGAYWNVSDAKAIASVGRYLALSMKPDETFLDFANSGAYFFLFRRDCPIREYEVAFFQTEPQQREIIRRIESNPKIRAVLLSATPHGRFVVDIPNAWRAPLVQQYLVENFEPDFEEGEIVFWRRK
ncbi:MAG: hypothetical protein ABI779_21185 [Acidobacteriota bacterium]